MAGKYAQIVNTLPRMAGEEPSYQEKINAAKRAILEDPDFTLHASTLAQRYVAIRHGESPDSINEDERTAIVQVLGKAGLEELLAECNLQLVAVEQMLAEQYEVESTTSLKLDSGESVAAQVEPYATVTDKETYRLWCIEEGFASLMTVPWTTTNAETKRRLLEGLAPPPGVEVFAKTKFVLRKA